MALQEVHDANLACYPACWQELRAKAPRPLLGGAGEEEPAETIAEENALRPDEKTESGRAEAGPGVLGKKTLTLVHSHCVVVLRLLSKNPVSLQQGTAATGNGRDRKASKLQKGTQRLFWTGPSDMTADVCLRNGRKMFIIGRLVSAVT